jgi:hypothetical protein
MHTSHLNFQNILSQEFDDGLLGMFYDDAEHLAAGMLNSHQELHGYGVVRTISLHR